MTRAVVRRGVVLLAVLAAAELVGSGQQSPLQVPGAIRSRVTLVPVEVYVTDRTGRPLTNLQESDFTVLEDGVRQTLSAFSTNEFRRTTGGRPTSPATPISPAASSASPGRTFLILLGRGRLDEPSHGLAALDELVRTGLDPKDRVGVMAYTRATDAVTEREPVLRLLDRYRERYRWIEARLDHWFQGLTLVYGGPAIPAPIQRDIDAIFDAPGLPRLRDLPMMEPPGDFEFENVSRWVDNAADPLNDPDDLQDPRYSAEIRQDFEALYNGIEYLRYAKGPRHIIYVTEDPLPFGPKGLVRLAQLANDAGVSVWPLQTGGNSPGGLRAPRIGTQALIRPSFGYMLTVLALRAFSEDTGGRASVQQFANKGLAALEYSTRFQYVLGYYPSHAGADGKYHKLDVRVNRKDAEMRHRAGYFARDLFIPTDERQFLANQRLQAGGQYWRDIRDIPLTWQEPAVMLDTATGQVSVRASIDPSGIAFETVDGASAAAVDVAVFAIDGKGRLVGEARQAIDLKFDPASLAGMKTSGIPYVATVATKGEAREVRLVVYQYAVDRLGTIAAKIPR